MHSCDVIIIGSGIIRVTAVLLAHYGKRVIVCESHTILGGSGQIFRRQGFEFDSGSSFYCGLTDARSLNPVELFAIVMEVSLFSHNSTVCRRRDGCNYLEIKRSIRAPD